MIVKDLVSIVIPAYNAEAFIKAAIESVLAQGHRPLEVIVVDDGSSDGTADIAESFGPPVTCYRQNNGGPPVARNRGLAVAQGEYIGFLDADDLYEPGRIEFQLNKLMDNPAVEVVIGRKLCEQLASAPDEPAAFKPMEVSAHIDVSLGVCLFRRTAFERVGLMEESLRHCDDWDWFMRARELAVPMLLHEETVLRYRLHMNNITRDQEAGKRYLAIMLKRSIDRRRAQSGKAESLTKLSDFRETVKSNDGAST
jgi:glycosyltransferase involved in cell wall biosynthesis